MFNPSKAIMIVGVILLAFLVISVARYVIYYNAMDSFSVDNELDYTTSDIEAVNDNYEYYEGEQDEYNTRSLIIYLNSNAKSNIRNKDRVPAVYYEKTGETVEYSGNEDEVQDYIDALTAIKNDLESDATYNITLSYGSNGLVDKISIAELADEESETKNSTTSDEVTDEDVKAFNETFDSISYKNSGSNVIYLLKKLEDNCDQNYETIEKVPSIYYEENNKLIKLNSTDEDGKNTYSDEIFEVKKSIKNKHTYSVMYSYQDNGYIDTIFIWTDYDNTSTTMP